MKKFLLSAIALTLTFLMLTCAVLTGCSGKEATPSPDQKQSMQSGESVDSKKVEPAPTAEPQPTAETTETYYGFTLDGEARYIMVSMSYLDYKYFDLFVDDSELAGRLQEVLESCRFRKLDEAEYEEFSDDLYTGGTYVMFFIRDAVGNDIGHIAFIGDFVFNDEHERVGYTFFDDRERVCITYIDENGEKQVGFFAATDCENLIQLRNAIYDAAMADHTCEEYYNLYMSGQETNVKRSSDMGFDSDLLFKNMTIFEHKGD